ncbi:MAG: peptide-methionine (S)-S-oxide reductase MsrA [Wenzhouxiangella sp.]
MKKPFGAELFALVSLAFFAMTMLVSPVVAEDEPGLARATFAGGCFWCMEPPYDRIEGVIETISGFSGGQVPNPSYEQVMGGRTGHLEVVQVLYDPARVSYEELVHVFWRNIDPFQADGQFCDRGPMYRSAIFAHGDEQYRQAQTSLEQVTGYGLSDQPIDTRVNPTRYRYYRWRCGRDQRLEALWGDEAGG